MLSLWFTLRQLRRSPAHMVAVVLSLGIGMAVSAAVFSVINVVLFAAVPGLVNRSTVIHIRWIGGEDLLTPTEFEVVERELAPALDGVIAQGERRLPVLLPGGIVTTNVAFVSDRLFETLGTRAVQGRLLDRRDAGETAWSRAVMSEAMWRRQYGADPGAVGRSIMIGGRAFSIVGVSPSGFPGLRLSDAGLDADAAPQLWVPLTAAARDTPWLSVGGRLGPGSDPKHLQARLALAAAHAARDSQVRRDPPVLRWFRAGLNWRSDPVGALLTMGVVLMVPLAIFAIGCANVLNLQLARATDRARELSVRLTLGASRIQLLRLLALEVVILTCIAAGVGWVGAWLLLRALQPLFMVTLTLARSVWWLLLFLITLVMATAGSAPAWLALRNVIAQGAKQGGDSVPHQQLKTALVVVQIAASVVLLCLSGLGIRTLQSQEDTLPADADNILTAEFDLSAVRQPRPAPAVFVDGILARLQGQHPIRAAAFATFLRFGQPARFWLSQDDNMIRRTTYTGAVTGDWFDVMGIRFLAGGRFRDGGGLTDVVVNEALSSQLGGRTAVVGRRFRLSGRDGSVETREVVGVVEDQLMAPLPMALVPMPAVPPSFLTLVVRTTDTATALPIVRKAVHAQEPLAPVDSLRTLASAINGMFGSLRHLAVAGAALGALAVLLAALGEYAVLAFVVRRRTREIGIRIAVGATRWSVLRLVVRQAVSVTTIGLLLGFCLAVPLAIVMRSSFFGVSPVDPLAMTPVAVGMLLVGVAAALLPAMRAVRVDPTVALRDE